MTSSVLSSVRLPRQDSRLATALLVIALLMLPFGVRHKINGDGAEYALMTIALASHGTPEIRDSDIVRARHDMPKLAEMLDALEAGRATRRDVPLAGFHLDREGNTQAIHFMAYSLLAVLPYKVLGALGLPAMKCFQFVNIAMVCVLLLSLRRFFGALLPAVGGVALFLTCNGFHYLNWSSPETVSAAALLSGLLLCASRQPLAAGALIGLGATQNPSVVLALGLLPVIVWCSQRHNGFEAAAGAAWAAVWRRPVLGGIAAGATLFATAPLFNLYAFGVPSIIAVGYTDPALASWQRLHSLFFDLSQGMILAVPGVLLATLRLALQRQPRARGAQHGRLLLVCAVLAMVGMAGPALVVTNWNSGASGVMRYAFWCAMPLLFALFWLLRHGPRPSAGLLVVVALVQLLAAVHGSRYTNNEFSPLAHWVLRHAPALYNPDPEVFYERSLEAEVAVTTSEVIVHREQGRVVKTMYNLHDTELDRHLCGPGRRMAAGNESVPTTLDWRYIDGPVRCEDTSLDGPLRYTATDFHRNGILGVGWSRPQLAADPWSGTWSSADASHIVLKLPAGIVPRRLGIVGMYHPEAGRRTHVRINDRDYGWIDLERSPPLDLPPVGPGSTLTVELRHEPHAPPAGSSDQRRLGLFLRSVVVM